MVSLPSSCRLGRTRPSGLSSGLSHRPFCITTATQLGVPPHSSPAHHPQRPRRSRRVDDNCSPYGSKLTYITPDTETVFHNDSVVASEAGGPRTITRAPLYCTLPSHCLLYPHGEPGTAVDPANMSSPTISNTTIVPDAVLGPIGQPLQTLIPPPRNEPSPPFIPERGRIPWMTSALPPAHIPRGLSP